MNGCAIMTRADGKMIFQWLEAFQVTVHQWRNMADGGAEQDLHKP
jgi:hypothetical protein